MTRAKISQLDAAAANNTDINAVNVAEGCPPSGINNAIREMGAMLKRMDNGTDHLTDPNITGSLDVDNININGNTISSTDTNGNINITPNGSGAVAFTTNATFGDNDKAIFGAGSDLQIWHDAVSGNSFIEDAGTGNLYLKSDGSGVVVNDGTNTIARFLNTNSMAELWYSGGKKLETTATGVDVTGTLTADGLTVDADVSTFNGATVNIDLMESDTTNANTRFRQSASGLSIQTVNDAASSATNRMRIDHTTGDISFRADDGTTDALFFDASTQRLGLGTTSPSYQLDVQGQDAGTDCILRVKTLGTQSYSDAFLILETAGSGISGIHFGDAADNNVGLINYDHSDDSLYIRTNATERMRIDSSGNLLVGRTTIVSGNEGVVLFPTGLAKLERDSNNPLLVNRMTNDGDIAVFQKDGTTVGSIRTGGSSIMIGNGDTGLFFDNTNDNIRVVNISTGGSRDNAVDLGESLTRFDDIYATNGTIQTSDQQEKNTITDSDLGLDFINRLSPKSYIFNGKTRTHYGLIAQEVETVLGDISKPTSGFAGFIKSDISEEEDGSEYRYGLRYTEFVGPLIQAIKDLKTENDAMRARLDALEAN